MSESENIAAADAPGPAPTTSMDAEDRLRPEFVDKVLDAVEAGDDVTARELVEPLHPADIADLFELAARDEREGLVKALAGIVDADVLAEMNEHVREALLEALGPSRSPTSPDRWKPTTRSRMIEDLDEDEQRAVLRRWSPTTARRSRKRSTIPRNPPAA